MTPEEFRVAGHMLIDWIADHRTRVPELPVRAQVEPGQVVAGLGALGTTWQPAPALAEVAARGGLRDEPAPLTVYTTAQAHSSVARAVLLAGYGRDNLRLVDIDPTTYALRPDALADAVTVDVAAGRRPAADRALLRDVAESR